MGKTLPGLKHIFRLHVRLGKACLIEVSGIVSDLELVLGGVRKEVVKRISKAHC